MTTINNYHPIMHKVWYDIFTKKTTEYFNMEKLRSEMNNSLVSTQPYQLFFCVYTQSLFMMELNQFILQRQIYKQDYTFYKIGEIVMIFKVLYQDTPEEYPVRERTKSLFV